MILSSYVISVAILCACLFSEVLYSKRVGKRKTQPYDLKTSFERLFHDTEFLGLTLKINTMFLYSCLDEEPY